MSDTTRDPGYPFGEPDAMKWATEFEELFAGRAVEKDTMLGWFANAIETGRLVEQKRMAVEIRTARLEVEGVAATLRFILANQLVKDGHATDIAEAARIVRDPSRLAKLYPPVSA